MTDIVERLSFDATRCEVSFSKGVASNIEEAIAEITRLRRVVADIAEFCSGDNRTLGAIERLAHIQNTAARAVR